MTPEQRYEDLIEEFLGEDGVLPPPGGSGFGRGAIRYRRKIFAMFVRGQLVLKLPRNRVDQLVAEGHGARFDANKGTPMKEWFSLDPESQMAWPPLAREALGFARSISLGAWTCRWPTTQNRHSSRSGRTASSPAFDLRRGRTSPRRRRVLPPGAVSRVSIGDRPMRCLGKK